MSKTANTADQPAEEAVVPLDQITLHEFCLRLSESIRRPELISAFEHVERRAGRIKDTDAAFRSRYDQFINAPV